MIKEIIRYAGMYNSKYGFNILPLKNKVPMLNWERWQTDMMSQSDINWFSWESVNGIGAVSGIKELRCLDFDHVTSFDIVKQFLRALGLPAEYYWTVKSGSGKGYHIWFYSSDDSYLFNILGGQKSYYKLKLINSALCDHIELRWKDCQTVLPPSLHQSGNKYKFKFLAENTVPYYHPYSVPAGSLINTLEKYCVVNLIKETLSFTPPKQKTSQCVSPLLKGIESISSEQLQVISEIAEFLSGRISNYDDWMHIGFALASLREQGREYFMSISRNNQKYNETDAVLNQKFTGFLKDYRGDITMGTFYEIAKRYGYKLKKKCFWKSEGEKVNIYVNMLIEFLEDEGFAKIYIDENECRFVKITDNVITTVSGLTIKDHVINYVNLNTQGVTRSLIREKLMRSESLFSNSTLEFLKTVNADFVTDTADKAFFFFSNCFVEVTQDSIASKPYSELKGKIWAKQKSRFSFNSPLTKGAGGCEFETLIHNICAKNNERINALKSAIGYLLHSYKDPSCAKAVIFADEKLSENAYGRSGKGLVARAVSCMKNVLQIDGKNFTFEAKFVFQSINPDTQLIMFDDVNRRFCFDKLFSVITEGMTIEKKKRDEFRIPFEKSPKILITTNHSVPGNDDSSIDRQFVVEFSDYYNAKHKPKHEFGHLLFTDWNNQEWNRFFYFMAECCRYYLKHGLKEYKYINLKRKKVIDSTSQEFEEFMRSLEMDHEYERKDLYEQFRREYGDFSQLKQHTFSKWIRIYADLNNLTMKERKTGTERCFSLS